MDLNSFASKFKNNSVPLELGKLFAQDAPDFNFKVDVGICACLITDKFSFSVIE